MFDRSAGTLSAVAASLQHVIVRDKKKKMQNN
jgi:hypothetical protein